MLPGYYPPLFRFFTLNLLESWDVRKNNAFYDYTFHKPDLSKTPLKSGSGWSSRGYGGHGGTVGAVA